MNIRDIEYIIAVAEQGSFSGAAARCHVSQPSLSAQIKKVEDELGVRIFDRTKRSVKLSLYGQSFMVHARKVMEEVERIKKEARQQTDPFTGTLAVGAIATVAPYFFPRILPHIHDKAPSLSLILKENVTGILLKSLLDREIDVAILSLPTDDNVFKSMPLFDDPFYLAVAENHPLVKQKSVNDELLKTQKLILLDEEHCFRAQALAICQSSNMQEDKAFKATSLETIRHVVATGQGMTLMPGLARRDNDEIAYIPIEGRHYSRTIGLVWRKGSDRSTFFHAFGSLIKDL